MSYVVLTIAIGHGRRRVGGTLDLTKRVHMKLPFGNVYVLLTIMGRYIRSEHGEKPSHMVENIDPVR